MVVPVKYTEEFDALICGEKPVVVAFTASWDSRCKGMAPVFEALAGSEDFKALEFAEVEEDEAKDIAQKYNIRVFPTYMVFRRGEAVDTTRGANVTALENLIRAHAPAV
ncbi:thioredoxin domain-containing protein [Streptomyces sp. enrichment culture]|uniref:thioredoxin domain-containing protein n=1 Tax=Streptomyces sp. enrichment culture TaxID=1795815 RepID=UPI003F54E4AE